jgi:hypothetical protein
MARDVVLMSCGFPIDFNVPRPELRNVPNEINDFTLMER